MAGEAGSDGVQLAFKALTGESLTDLRVDRSCTVDSISKMLAERVPLPARKSYQLVLGVDVLAPSDALSKHVAGGTAELIACVESDDSSDESAAKKTKDDTKAKSKKKRKDDKKSKKKEIKSKGKKDKKRKKDDSSSSSSQRKKKKKAKKDEEDDFAASAIEEDPVTKKAWVADRLDELRQIRPPLPLELCLVRANKDWIAHKKKKVEDEIKKAEDKLLSIPIVRQAMREAEEEAKAKGMSDAEVKDEVDKAALFAIKVAKDNKLIKDDSDEEDPTKVPLFFQKRPGLGKAVGFLEKLE